MAFWWYPKYVNGPLPSLCSSSDFISSTHFIFFNLNFSNIFNWTIQKLIRIFNQSLYKWLTCDTLCWLFISRRRRSKPRARTGTSTSRRSAWWLNWHHDSLTKSMALFEVWLLTLYGCMILFRDYLVVCAVLSYEWIGCQETVIRCGCHWNWEAADKIGKVLIKKN